jgi:hypothetical protein
MSTKFDGTPMDPNWDLLIEFSDMWAEHTESCDLGCEEQRDQDDIYKILDLEIECSEGREILLHLAACERDLGITTN